MLSGHHCIQFPERTDAETDRHNEKSMPHNTQRPFIYIETLLKAKMQLNRNFVNKKKKMLKNRQLFSLSVTNLLTTFVTQFMNVVVCRPKRNETIHLPTYNIIK